MDKKGKGRAQGHRPRAQQPLFTHVGMSIVPTHGPQDDNVIKDLINDAKASFVPE